MNNELYPKAISDILGEKFFIPEYQRGYRWNKRQVVNMLDDIYEFYLESRNKDASVFYCLQPIVVKKRDDEWELIDGQQRLTTLHLILTFFKDLMTIFGKDKIYLRYATRTDSASFLEKIDQDRKDENIDFFHICEAYNAIEEWFDGKDGTLKSNLLQAITQPDEIGKNVKVIWYEVYEDVDSIDIFTRLNVGKIPLTNAELVKALFLRKENLTSRDTTLLQLKIAQEWDLIERKLHDDDFWYFISNTNEYSTRIEYVLKLMGDEFYAYLQNRTTLLQEASGEHQSSRFINAVDSLIEDKEDCDYFLTLENDDPYRIFFIFNKMFELTGKNAEQLWAEIKKYFMTFEEWYDDRYFFHIIGFLIKTNVSPKDIMYCANSSETKEMFKVKLKSLLLENSLKLDSNIGKENIVDYINSISYDSTKQSEIRNLLLLFNILSLIEDPASNLRFQFDAYSKQSESRGWDIEHIHSVASGKPERVDEKKKWLDNVFQYLTGGYDLIVNEQYENRDGELIDSIKALLGTEPFDPDSEFDDLYNDIIRIFGDESNEEQVDDSIANLTLLDAATNRSYKNAIFPIKRKRIIELDKKATFVPICTKNVFLKYYSRKPDKMFKWEQPDKNDYLDSMIKTISDFFTDKDGE